MLPPMYRRSGLKIALLLLCGLLAACGFSGREQGSAEKVGYQVVPVTPEVILQLARAQAAAPATASPPKSAAVATGPSAVTPLAEVKPTDEAGAYRYRIGKGDILHIKQFVYVIAGGSEGSGLSEVPQIDAWRNYNGVLVDEEGMISFPYAGRLSVEGKTLIEARKALEQKLARYFKNPQVVMEVREFRGRRAKVTGQVNTPGEQILTYEPLTVLKALQNAGGAKETADLAAAQLIRADGKRETLDLFALYHRGDASQNRVLLEGDTLQLPDNHRNKVFVMGEVKKPQTQSIQGGRLSLAEALGQAEGMNPETASKTKVYVIRGAISESLLAQPEAKPEAPLSATVYQIDLSSPEAYALAGNFPLQARDVVYVSPSGITEWSRFISQVLPPAASSLLLAGAVYNN